MASDASENRKLPYGLILLIAAQVICAVFFFVDVVDDYAELAFTDTIQWHLYFELAATLSLCAAIVFEGRYILRLLRRKAQLERSVSIATSAIHDVIESHFERWRLTPSEQDIANFLVKGCGIAEIAELRGSAEGTVKSHLNAIYRKSGTHNRAELMSLIIDSLMGGATARQR